MDDLTDSDKEVLDELQKGARTKGAIVDETGYHRNTVGRRLEVLEASDVIRQVHETTHLYELVDDPREDADSPSDAVKSAAIAQATLRETERELAECQREREKLHERVETLERSRERLKEENEQLANELEAAREQDSDVSEDVASALREIRGDADDALAKIPGEMETPRLRVKQIREEAEATLEVLEDGE